MAEILVPISPGELLDKITILRIKSRRISDADKLVHVRAELALLEQCWQGALGDPGALKAELLALEAVNEELWQIEDEIRRLEAEGRFDAAFVQLARSVYLRNDERAAIKRRINQRLNSAIVEEKSYQPYAASHLPKR